MPEAPAQWNVRQSIEAGERPWWICPACGALGLGGTQTWPKRMRCEHCDGEYQRADTGAGIPIAEEREIPAESRGAQ